jgi:D-alanyl-D-alanine carboxypeptidase/D-alanyl-D-alanine-endopeptidase (penicillin-binding protein 4)
MIPASNMKIITTAAALQYLGPNFVYQTVVGLNGNTLVIIGSGDPLLGDRVTDAKYTRQPHWLLRDVAQALKDNDVSSIEDIVVDTTVFDDQRTHPSWPVGELNRWYACETNGLNYNANCIEVVVSNNSGSIEITVEPPNRFIKMINQVRPITQGKSAVGCYRTEKLNTIIVRGRCQNRQGPFAVAIERPAAFLAFLLTEHLRQQDIEISGNVIEKAFAPGADFKVLTVHNTLLSDCLKRANKDSFGLAAESLLKTIAASQNSGKNGNWEMARELVSDYLISLRIPPEQFFIDDGSGLSRNNKISASAITRVLLDQYKGGNWQIYRDSLAIGGLDGTIRKYFKETPYKGNIRGKTGYINSVKSFSGICSVDGKDYIFSILTYKANGKTRGAINNIAEAIIDHAK